MTELPWFERDLKFGYPIQLLPYFLERLEGTYARIQLKIKGIPDEILSVRLEGKWSVKQNIGHLAEVDQVAFKRVDEMIRQVPVMSPAVFEPQDYNPWPIGDLLAFFHKTRSESLRQYHSLTVQELTKSSIHPRLKVSMTPVDLAWFDAEHDDHHLVKMSEILKKLNAKIYL